MLKRYLPDERDRLRLIDVVMEEARRVHGRLSDVNRYPVRNKSVTNVRTILEIVHRYEADTQVLVHLLAHLGAYGDRADHRQLAVRAFDLIANPEGERAGLVALLALRRYPALLGFYALGLGTVSTSNWPMLRAAALEARWHDINGSEHLVAALHPYRVFEGTEAVAQALATGETNPSSRAYTPHSDYLHGLLRHPLTPLLDSDQRYDTAFDQLEYLSGVLVAQLDAERTEQAERSEDPWVPPPYIGRQRWRYRHAQSDPISRWAESEKDTLGKQLGVSKDGSVSWDASRASYEEHLAAARSRRR